MTLESVAATARHQPQLRGPKGGRYTAEAQPELLERQYREFLEMFGEGQGRGLPGAIRYFFLAVLALALTAGGYFGGLLFLGSGAVAGAGSVTDTAGPYGGAGAGLIGGLIAAYLLRPRAGAGSSSGGEFETVYARARITQVEYRDDAGRPVERGAPGARRHVVRRMLTYLQRAAFADRQQGVFVAGIGQSQIKRFRTGEIRLETTKDLSKLTGPEELFDAWPLSGHWKGVASIRWYVALRDPIETGMYARDWDLDSEPGGAARRFLMKNFGVWILLGCGIAGFIMFMSIMDPGAPAGEELVDRTPAAAEEAAPN